MCVVKPSKGPIRKSSAIPENVNQKLMNQTNFETEFGKVKIRTLSAKSVDQGGISRTYMNNLADSIFCTYCGEKFKDMKGFKELKSEKAKNRKRV